MDAYGVIPYNAEGDKKSAQQWQSLGAAVAKVLNPANYARAARELVATPQDAELLPKRPFVGPPNPYEEPSRAAEFLPLAATSEFNVGMPVPRRTGPRGATGSWGSGGASGSWGGPAAPPTPVRKQSSGGGGAQAPNSAVAQPAPEAMTPVAASKELDPDEKALKEFNKLVDKFEGNKKLDLSPLIALTDSWTGSRLMAGYNRPMSDDEREKVVIGLREHAMQKEADLRYKKAYLASMAEQDKTRKAINDADNATEIEKARIAAASRVKPVDPTKVQDRLWRNNKGLATHVAQARYGNPANPKDKGYREMAQLVHQEALDVAENAVENGDAPDFETGYQMAMQALVNEAQQQRGGGGQQKPAEQPQGGW